MAKANFKAPPPLQKSAPYESWFKELLETIGKSLWILAKSNKGQLFF